MYQAKLKKDIRSPLDAGMDLFGGKWKARIISTLTVEGPLRYGQLRQEMGNISDTVLSAALRELIADAIVSRHTYDEIPPRVEYRLTEKGRSMAPLLCGICQWTREHHACSFQDPLPHCRRCEREGLPNLNI